MGVALVRVWRIKGLFRQADRRYRGAALRLEGVSQLLALPGRRRVRRLRLARAQWLRAVEEDPDRALKALADAVVNGLDVATDEFVEGALARWIRSGRWGRLEQDTYERLREALATTGRSLAVRLTDLYRGEPGLREHRSAREVRDMLMEYHPEHPPMELLMAVGPLGSEADWWCDLGYRAIQDGDLELADRHFTRAHDLGCQHVRKWVVYLALLRVAEVGDRVQVHDALRTARELHPALDHEQLFYLGCRGVLAGVEPDVEAMVRLRVDRPDLRQLWLAQHFLRVGNPVLARARLRSCVRKAKKLTQDRYGYLDRHDDDPDPSDVLRMAKAQLAQQDGRVQDGRESARPDARLLPSVDRFDPGYLHEALPSP
ncbi:hypothetical protein AB0F71_21840 [Kitasatospora sp. NPDC028055]|uniref:hypothetical protein n=1 Tax=Kitasatospora sp. NPDC028055 TaxID=3155653 RepID=UPI0033D7B7C3